MHTDPRIAVCPGSYDPITFGHLDVISRPSELFDEVVVAVVNLPIRKGRTLFDIDERLGFIEAATEHLANVRAEPFDGWSSSSPSGSGPARSSRDCARSPTSSTRWR